MHSQTLEIKFELDFYEFKKNGLISLFEKYLPIHTRIRYKMDTSLNRKNVISSEK